MCARERERERERGRLRNGLIIDSKNLVSVLLFEYRGNLKMNFNRIYGRFVPDNEYTSTLMGF